MILSAYKPIVEYHFQVAGVDFAITSWDAKNVCVEETHKNGQEDTHFCGDLEMRCGRWVLTKYSRKHLVTYWSKNVADSLERYLNMHGLPEQCPFPP